MRSAAILDIDGTLVDSNYHHALAWGRAFAGEGVEVPIWRIHRHVGMGGDLLVEAIAGEDVEDRLGDRIRDTEGELYSELIGEVRPLPGAREVIQRLRDRDRVVVLASSAKEDEVEHYLDLLDAHELAHGWTTSADVEATKPEPDLIEAALAKAAKCGWERGAQATMVGDSVWDVKAALRAEIDAVGVLTGGFGEQELREAGAALVFESVAEIEDVPQPLESRTKSQAPQGQIGNGSARPGE